jgi:hypothetical protein
MDFDGAHIGEISPPLERSARTACAIPAVKLKAPREREDDDDDQDDAAAADAAEAKPVAVAPIGDDAAAPQAAEHEQKKKADKDES